MKKFLSIVLVLAMALSMAACGGKTEGAKTEGGEATEETKYTPDAHQATVNNPTKWPCYALEEGAGVDEMRAAAVQAMRDELTVKWTPVQHFSYAKTGAGDKYDYQFDPTSVYAGILYASGGAGMLQWLSCIDPETGILYDANFTNMVSTQGSSCSAAVCWGLTASCNSIQKILSTYYLLPENGFYPLGDVKFPEIKSFKEHDTLEIIKDNGETAVYEGYALALPGDPLVSSGSDATAGHAMMVIKPANVVRNADGSLDVEKSTLTVQDQRFKDQPVQEDGQTIMYRGRLEAEISFKELLKEAYIAETTAEFMGNAPYVKAEASLNKEVKTVKDLQGSKIKSNYMVAVAYCTVSDESGKKLIEGKKMTIAEEINSGTACILPMSLVLQNSDVKKKLEDGKTYHFNVEAVVSTGERITLLDADLAN